jgi:arylsulfatase A-like enzyme
LIDVLPTVADLLGVEIDYPTAGRSLVGYMENKEATHRIAFSSMTKDLRQCSIRDGRYKYIEVFGFDEKKPSLEVPTRQLYDLWNDPGENVNLAPTNPELAKAYSSDLHERIKGAGEPPTIDESEILEEKLRRRLKSLGYLG